MKAFFSKIKAWIVANKVLAGIIAGAVVLAVTAAIVIPVSVSSAKKKQQQEQTQQSANEGGKGSGEGSGEGSGGGDKHTHTFDEFGICACGVIEEKVGIEFISAGVESEHKELAASTVTLFKLRGYKDHPITFGIAFRYNKDSIQLKWVENGQVKTNDIKGGSFTPEVSGIYYVHAETDSSIEGTKEAYVKYAYEVGSKHTHNENGFCECGNAQGYTSVNIGAQTADFNSEVGDVHKFSFAMHKNHKYIAHAVSSFPGEEVEMHYFDKSTGLWADAQNVDKNGLSVFNNGAFFIAPANATYYAIVRATHKTSYAHFKFDLDESTHSYTEYGLCTECAFFNGETITVQNDDYATYDMHEMTNGEKRYVRWKVPSGKGYNRMYIGGTHIATYHTLGLYNANGEKLLDVAYNRTIENPDVNSYYYIILTANSIALQADAALRVHCYTAA